jgi:hypothetical protein
MGNWTQNRCPSADNRSDNKEGYTMTTKKLEKMDGLDLMHWLILACEAKGAKVFCRGTGPGDDQAELDIDLEGHPYIISIKRQSKQKAESNRNPKELASMDIGSWGSETPAFVEALNQADKKSEMKIKAKYGDEKAELRGELILATDESTTGDKKQ